MQALADHKVICKCVWGGVKGIVLFQVLVFLFGNVRNIEHLSLYIKSWRYLYFYYQGSDIWLL